MNHHLAIRRILSQRWHIMNKHHIPSVDAFITRRIWTTLEKHTQIKQLHPKETTIFHGVLAPLESCTPPCRTWHFIFDRCKVSFMHAFGAICKHLSLLLHSGELLFSFSLLMCSSSRWFMMAKLLDSQDLPMEDPVSNTPAVAVVFGLGRALWSRTSREVL